MGRSQGFANCPSTAGNSTGSGCMQGAVSRGAGTLPPHGTGLAGLGADLKILTCRCWVFCCFFNLLVPSGVISILTCTANMRHFTYKLPAGMTPSILHSIHKTYYLFQFKRDHCWIIQLLMRIYIYIYSKQNTCPIYFFFLSHLHKCERKQKNQCVYTHECLQIMF